MKVVTLSILLAALLAGCMPSPSLNRFVIEEKRDPYRPGYVSIKGGELRIWGSYIREHMSLIPSYYWDEQQKEGGWSWTFFYVGSDWAFIRDIDVLLNKEPIRLTLMEEPMRSVLTGGDVTEGLVAIVPESLMAVMDSTVSISVRVNGDRRSFDIGELTSVEKSCLKKLYESVMARRSVWLASPDSTK